MKWDYLLSYFSLQYLAGPLGENHFGVIKAIVSYLIYSKIPVINVEAMCREWGVSKQKFYKLLSIIEEIELLNIVRKSSVEKPYSKGAKIFLSDPVMYSVFDGEIGNFREAYVVFSLKGIGKVLASKNEKGADFVFEGIKMEVRGKSKKERMQILSSGMI